MRYILLTALLLISLPLAADKVEQAAEVVLPAMDTPIGARATAMGEAFTAVADDASAVYWNPAGMTQLQAPAVGLSYNKWFADLSVQNLGAVAPVGGLSLGGLVSYVNFGSFPLRDGTGQEIGTTQPSNIGGVLAAAKGFGPFSFGVSLKGYQEKIADYSLSAFAADAGAQYRLGKFRLGACAHNLGKAGDFDIPMNIRIGVAYLHSLEHLSILLSGDSRVGIKDENVFDLGSEIGYQGMLFLRGGYKLKSADDLLAGSKGLCVGGGVRHGYFALDYAMVSFGEMGATHRTTLSFDFATSVAEAPAQAPVRKPKLKKRDSKKSVAAYNAGVRYEKEKDYRNAAKKYQESVKQDPDNAKAWRRLGVVYYRYKKKSSAIKCFRRYLKLNPDDEKIRRVLKKLEQ